MNALLSEKVICLEDLLIIGGSYNASLRGKSVIDPAYMSSISAITPNAMKFMITSIVVVCAQIKQMLMISVKMEAENYIKAIKKGDVWVSKSSGWLFKYFIMEIDCLTSPSNWMCNRIAHTNLTMKISKSTSKNWKLGSKSSNPMRTTKIICRPNMNKQLKKFL
jgi:hypothetical protein